MNNRQIAPLLLLVAAWLGLSAPLAQAQIPPSFPTLMITRNGPVAPGDFIGNIGAQGEGVTGTATNVFNAVLDNGAKPLHAIRFTNIWRGVTPSGLIPEQFGTSYWGLRDETFSVVETVSPGNGYLIDTHDFKLLPNGDALVLESENWPVDMRQYVGVGRPDAVLTSVVFQEIAANGQVLFEWHAKDHLAITNSLADLSQASVDWTHANSLTVDPLDNNYLLSLRSFNQILKISRTNGAVLWHLGGIGNDFTFIGENPANAPYYFIGQHSVHRLANGDILFFDNGTPQNSQLPARPYSRAVEYHLDETNRTATLVWQYRHVPDVVTPNQGIVQRFPNGNTYVCWVSAASKGTGPTFTEVNASNQVVFEVSIPGYKGPSWITEQVWNTPNLVHADTNLAVVAGQTCNGTNSGVTVTVGSVSGPANNELVVGLHDDAVRFALFPGKEPQVLVPRVTLTGTNITALTASLVVPVPANNFCFDTPLFQDPASLTIYQRSTVGQGVFAPLTTVYDPVTNTLTATITNLGEFIITYPDLPEVPLPPILYTPASTLVNQSEPVGFTWTSQGFVHSYHLQVATDPAFNNLVVDQAGLTNAAYTLASVLPGTNYYWRVNVANYGGVSDWSTASFTAVPPVVQVTSPAGGEAWQRGLPYFIRWTNNLAENVAIKLYKGGTPIATLTTNAANLGAYYWSINYSNAPASNYSIRISSATNSAVYGMSPLPFSIVDPPTFSAGSIVALPNGGVQFSLTANGAATATVLVSTNLTTWQVLQSVTLTNGSAAVADNTFTNSTSRFYRLSLP
jgi:hypothetical protein